MANKFTRFLNGVGTGLLTPKGQMADYRHAARLFVDDTFRLSPRTKFLFYVKFELDKSAMAAPAFTARHADEVGLLVKSTDLPKYTFDTTTKNQYNRKKIVYKNITYEPITITLHDDSAGIINALWAVYYGYYIRDRHLPNAAYGATHLRAANVPMTDSFRYGMDNNVTNPIFKSISIYTMSRRRFLGYTLVNPRIKSWNHGTVSYAEGGTLESQMQVEYESVVYTAGSVSQDSPKGFATLHYDNLPSPLSVAGGGVSNVLGQGGVLDGLETIFGDLANGSTFNSPSGFLGTAIAAMNTYNNSKNITASSFKSELSNSLTNPANLSKGISTVSGLVGAVFPKNTTTTDTTTASQKNLTQ